MWRGMAGNAAVMVLIARSQPCVGRGGKARRRRRQQRGVRRSDLRVHALIMPFSGLIGRKDILEEDAADAVPVSRLLAGSHPCRGSYTLRIWPALEHIEHGRSCGG